MTVESIQERRQLADWLNANGLVGSGVEVGSLSCGFSREIISVWRGLHLYLVDPWQAQAPEIYKERQDWIDFDACYRECQQLAQEYAPRIHLMRALSVDAAPMFEPNSLDFVYIDANHAFEAVSADLSAWFPKVISGGLLCGHDYWNDTKWPSFGQVKSAVNHWNSTMKLNMHYSPKCGSWWFRKP